MCRSIYLQIIRLHTLTIGRFKVTTTTFAAFFGLLMKLKPFPYQQKMIDEIIPNFKIHNKGIIQLNTSGGKTVIFSFFIKWYLSWSKQNVLVLAHREELVTQAEETLSELGIGSEVYFSKTRRLKNHSRVYLSMIETTSRRLQNNHLFFPNIGLVICDEAHLLIYDKVFDYFKNAKILGCTATPVVSKRETFYKCKYCRTNYTEPTQCCNEEETEEWTRPYSLSKIFDFIVIGPTPDELIEFGSIVREVSFIKHYTDDSTLKRDADGEFIAETVEKEYGSSKAVFNVLLNYEELCMGKKTLIFNSSAKTNLAVYNKFIEAGYTNVRMFDSVNSAESGNRKQLLEWFSNTPDAILLNVYVFAVGFNSREVQAILINCPIGSLSKFIQIAGRGCRSSIKIYKPNYILVDGGGNIERFGEPSTTRDWVKMFNGVGVERAKRINAADVQNCPECGALYPKSNGCCTECGCSIPESQPRIKKIVESDEVLAPIRPIPPPNGERIYEYTIRQGEDINFAFKIMIGQIVDMFKFYRISYDQYNNALLSGELDKKTMDQIRKCYFVLLRKKDIQTKGRRTLAQLLIKTKEQLNKYYESRGIKSAARVGFVVQEQFLSEAS